MMVTETVAIFLFQQRNKGETGGSFEAPKGTPGG